VLCSTSKTWISANELVAPFYYNGNGWIDVTDVVWLFNHL
jgi:PKD repeat protein